MKYSAFFCVAALAINTGGCGHTDRLALVPVVQVEQASVLGSRMRVSSLYGRTL